MEDRVLNPEAVLLIILLIIFLVPIFRMLKKVELTASSLITVIFSVVLLIIAGLFIF